jgi:hypothetical protein
MRLISTSTLTSLTLHPTFHFSFLSIFSVSSLLEMNSQATSAVICVLRASASGPRQYLSTAEHQLRSRAKTLFSQWTSYFGQFDGPKLLLGIVQQANRDLRPKYKDSISQWIVQLPQTSTSMVELVVSGNDGFLVTQRLLRDFFTSWESVKWRLTVYSTLQKEFQRMEVSSLFVHWESPEREASPHIVEFTASLAPADEGRRVLRRAHIMFSRVSGRGRNALPAALSSSPSRHREEPQSPRASSSLRLATPTAIESMAEAHPRRSRRAAKACAFCRRRKVSFRDEISRDAEVLVLSGSYVAAMRWAAHLFQLPGIRQ